MELTIDALCNECRNFFLGNDPGKNIHAGTFTISGGQIAPSDFLKQNQYFRLIGSTYNDGVHRFPAIDLVDESFDGAVWAMNVPPAFVALAEKVESYNRSEAAQPAVYSSESFGGYSRTRATGNGGMPVSWQKLFAPELNYYRRTSIL